MPEPVKLVYNVDGSDFASAGTASSSMKRVLKKLGLDAETIRRASICMYEGEINMVIHANGGEITVLIDPEKIVMSLADEGPGIADVSLAMQEGWSTAGEAARDLGFGAGMGLPNMKKYCDDMQIETELGVGTTVRMTIRMKED